jgi:hypothetical protein
MILLLQDNLTKMKILFVFGYASSHIRPLMILNYSGYLLLRRTNKLVRFSACENVYHLLLNDVALIEAKLQRFNHTIFYEGM